MSTPTTSPNLGFWPLGIILCHSNVFFPCSGWTVKSRKHFLKDSKGRIRRKKHISPQTGVNCNNSLMLWATGLPSLKKEGPFAALCFTNDILIFTEWGEICSSTRRKQWQAWYRSQTTLSSTFPKEEGILLGKTPHELQSATKTSGNDARERQKAENALL